ncbi:condensation domain-containing protein [Streptomyces sp. NE06-03C]|uniref:condensation domain-containing protein n=1 Tax=unclassified Streptomyces TaxID=2593676 RepID=UPI0029AB013A|nr:condensation domain-containing protein [Streptomyces sp. NE06-03C]MDX2918354.1 condensation domain-containing protein [Streptomyces sp. NE06-03C]
MTTSDTTDRSQDGTAPPLSFHQEFLCMFDRGNDGADVGPFGPMYHIVGAWRLTGGIDEETLREALGDVVVRHEALRTSLVREGGTHRPEILPAGPAALEVRDLGGVDESERVRRGEELLNEVESTGLSVRELPLLRAVLGRFDQKDSVLVLIAHHTAADAWAMHVIARDLLNLYAARRGNPVPPLPEPTQHAEFARWEREAAEAPRVAVSKEFWRKRLQGARIIGLETDIPRSAGLPKGTAWQRFAVRGELADAVVEFSRAAKCSPFMTMFAAYQVLLHRRTGELDITVPTFSGGRNNSRFEDTVGSFINFLPLRTDLSGCASFRDVVLRTRATCGEAFTHELPFSRLIPEVPELMASAASDNHQISVFQAVHAPAADGPEQAGDLTYSKIWERQLSQSEGSDIPDGVLWSIHIDPSGSMAGSLGYNTNRFKDETMAAFLADYLDLLEKSVARPDAPFTS